MEPWLFFFAMSPRRRRTPPPAPIPEALYPSLDLHGQTADEAERLAERWLRDQQRAGEGLVRIITGRGRHSIGPPVLPPTIEALLERLSGSVVRSHQRESGGGSLRVELARLKLRAAPATQADLRVDPELALQAHQSLEELGIQPTPTLVRLEMERIVKKPRGEAD